jgi:hypothetical protein
MQQNLADVGIKIEFEVAEWNTLINLWRAGAKSDTAKRRQRAELQLLHPGPVHRLHPPSASRSWWRRQRHQLGLLRRTPAWTRCSRRRATTFDQKASGRRRCRKLHEKIVDDAAVPDGHARRQRRAMRPEGEGLRAGAELVPGLLAGITMK